MTRRRCDSAWIGASEKEGGPTLDAERVAACLADRRSGDFFLVDANGGLLPESGIPEVLAETDADIAFTVAHDVADGTVLTCADMVTLRTARVEAAGDDGLVRPPDAPESARKRTKPPSPLRSRTAVPDPTDAEGSR